MPRRAVLIVLMLGLGGCTRGADDTTPAGSASTSVAAASSTTTSLTTPQSTVAPTATSQVSVPIATMPGPDRLIDLFDSCLTQLRLPAAPAGMVLTRDTGGNVNPWLAATLSGRSADGRSGMALYLLPDEASLLLASPNEDVVSGVRLTSGLLEDGVVGVERRGVPGNCPLIAAEGWGRVTTQDLVNYVASIGIE